MDIQEIRRARLRQWLEGKTAPSKEKSYFSQLLGGTSSFGERAARRLERDYGMGEGYLDRHPEVITEPVKPQPGADQIETKLNETSETSAYNVARLPDQHTPVGGSPAQRVYVVGQANGGLPERIWTDGGYLVGATEEYAVLATDDPHAFLTPIIGTSMAPVYNPGDFAFVEPGTEVELGDDVLVRLSTGETMLKQLRSLRNGVQLGSYGEPGTLFFKPEEITWMYYVAHPVRRKKIKTRF
jgi:phage repressor protein C with HTH and peptisase S24 domain